MFDTFYMLTKNNTTGSLLFDNVLSSIYFRVTLHIYIYALLCVKTKKKSIRLKLKTPWDAFALACRPSIYEYDV